MTEGARVYVDSEVGLRELVDKLKDGDLRIKPEMNISIIEEIREAVLRSCVVEPEIIDMLI